MPQRWHWLRLRTTCHPTEDPDRVRAALKACTGLDDETFAAALSETEMEAHHGGQAILMDVLLARAKEVRSALGVMWTDAARETLIQELEPRTDDHGVLHWRMGKQRAFQGILATTRGDDAIQARLKPEVHPASRDAAVAVLATELAA